MSYYSASIMTEVINPVFDKSKLRSEFRLDPDMLYSSYMRVMNLGVYATLGSFENNRRYNLLSGVCGMVKNIFLYDDKKVLDQVLNYKDYGGFKNFNNSNSMNMDYSKNLKKHGLGFVYDTDNVDIDDQKITTLVKEFNQFTGGHIPGVEELNTPVGYLDLREVFPLLKSLEFLPTSLFKNLKVVIEYDVNDSLSISENNTSAPVGTTTPILVVDKIVDDVFVNKWVNEFKGVTWNCLELETVELSEPTVGQIASGVQSIKYRLNGFSDKTLSTLLLKKKPLSTVSQFYSDAGSLSLVNETIQLSINGSNLFPNEGITGYNQRLALLNDSFGNCNLTAASNIPSFPDVENSIENFEGYVGELDYFGCIVNKKINSLDVNFSRALKLSNANETVNVEDQYLQAVELQFWGSVSKSLFVGKNQTYQVTYN